MTDFILMRDGKEVEKGETIVSSGGQDYIFIGFTRGRLGPKVYVTDPRVNGMKREFFANVFPDYTIIEESTK